MSTQSANIFTLPVFYYQTFTVQSKGWIQSETLISTCITLCKQQTNRLTNLHKYYFAIFFLMNNANSICFTEKKNQFKFSTFNLQGVPSGYYSNSPLGLFYMKQASLPGGGSEGTVFKCQTQSLKNTFL